MSAYEPHTPQRVLLGRSLLLAGIAGWLAAVGWLVSYQKANIIVMSLALLSWLVFFAGKTLLKAPDPKSPNDA